MALSSKPLHPPAWPFAPRTLPPKTSLVCLLRLLSLTSKTPLYCFRDRQAMALKCDHSQAQCRSPRQHPASSAQRKSRMLPFADSTALVTAFFILPSKALLSLPPLCLPHILPALSCCALSTVLLSVHSPGPMTGLHALMLMPCCSSPEAKEDSFQNKQAGSLLIIAPTPCFLDPFHVGPLHLLFLPLLLLQ